MSPEVTYNSLLKRVSQEVHDFGHDINFQIELNLKYAGYIQRQESDVNRLGNLENILIPSTFDFATILGCATKQKRN